MAAARAARANAYAPYSHFRVGAAVLAGGRVFTGVNVENAAYPIGVCAERIAVGAAVTAGERDISVVAVVGSADRPTPPCGGCRQFISEFGPDVLVVAEADDGRRSEWGIADLLPDAFGPAFLE
ncbi:MAG: cytidine deaminase [Actinomycetota bacterium]|nr:cytidine deaminase [Actinomycetota bacterium]